MIKIDKGNYKTPAVLLNEGVAERNANSALYEGASAGFHLTNNSTRSKFEFSSDIYAHDTVKELLKHIQSHKCCFCEAKITHISYGDVEHFRPKAAYKQDENSNLEYPGYFWLAYEWSNLYLSCQICNGRNKLNYFPLEDNLNRANPLLRDIALEDPSFIDPGGNINPEDHISFHGAIPESSTAKGTITIKYLGLDREELNEDRLESLARLRALENIVEITADSIKAPEARKRFLDLLETCVSEWSEYSSMFKCNFKTHLAKI
ncbi:HNH endonuclease family protein [Pontibacter pamirensis]|uniref:hypothetical protein n=1 Tax=Pontibacter pamirensis TaxID=2562824 RepID=UPI0013897E88|nr:hypothetical protein [Pontibacter pamirensis]